MNSTDTKKKLALVIGSGMLGHEVNDSFERAGWDVVTTELNSNFLVDIGEMLSVEALFDRVKRVYERDIDAVVNAAAMTKVDACETAEMSAYRTNCVGARNVARACIKNGVRLFVHVSTDYVYDRDDHGMLCPGFNFYNPPNAYGRTKLAGDLAIEAEYKWAKQTLDRPDDIGYLIARTSRLFGKYRYSFVDFVCETCLSDVNGAEEPASPQPFKDLNITIPTNARLVADEIVKSCIATCVENPRPYPVRSGYANFVSDCLDTQSAPTLYGYAEAIYEILKELGLKPYKWFKKDEDKSYKPYEVPRPTISTMATSIENAPNWRDALKDYIKEKYIDAKTEVV